MLVGVYRDRNESEQNEALDTAVTVLLVLSGVRFMDYGATRDCCGHLASLAVQRRAQNRPELMPCSRAVLVAQRQGPFQPSLACRWSWDGPLSVCWR